MQNRMYLTAALWVFSAVVAQSPVSLKAQQVDLTRPDTKSAKLDFTLNGLGYTLEAPEGSKVSAHGDLAIITKGDDFKFTIELGKHRFESDKAWWQNPAADHPAAQMVADKKDVLLIQTSDRNKLCFVSTTVSVPYIDITVRNDDDLSSRANCLSILRCARTIALKSPPPADPSAILEWLKADVRKNDDGKVETVALHALTTDAAFPLLRSFTTLKSLTIQGGAMTGEGLAELEGMPGLEELGLAFGAISEPMLAHVGKVPGLKTLSLGVSAGTADIDQTALTHLRKLSALETLDLTNTNAGDVALSCLKEMRGLKVLRLGSTFSADKREGPKRTKLNTLSDAGLENLAGLTNLETLSLRRTDITGAGFKNLAGLTKLLNLELDDTFVNDEGLKQIGALESLQLLQIARSNVTSEGLRSLANLNDLKELDLTDTQIDDEGLKFLSSLVHLESLQLRRTHVTDAGMLHLESFKHLESLNLSETKVTDAGLPHLYRLKNLQSVSTSDTAVTQDGLDKLEQARERQQ